MHALNERNEFKASEYYIKFCRRFINRVYFISSAISNEYLLWLNWELFTKQWSYESDIFNALILIANVYIDFETHHLNKRPSAVCTSICKSTAFKHNAAKKSNNKQGGKRFIYHETQHSSSSQNNLSDQKLLLRHVQYADTQQIPRIPAVMRSF